MAILKDSRPTSQGRRVPTIPVNPPRTLLLNLVGAQEKLQVARLLPKLDLRTHTLVLSTTDNVTSMERCGHRQHFFYKVGMIPVMTGSIDIDLVPGNGLCSPAILKQP